MALIAGVLKERAAGERRVAATPRSLPMLADAGLEVWIEAGAGLNAGFPDADYASRSVRVTTGEDILKNADLLLAVQVSDSIAYRAGQTAIGFCDPLNDPRAAAEIARRGVTLFSMELMPRITRAQSMDALSSMATIAGYKAVLMAANSLGKMFPMLMTAAGTIPPARVLVIGAGVAGLQAIATAKRLGAVVSGYDVRAAVREQIESLGAKFVTIDVGESAEGSGGYARQLSEAAIRRQQEQMAAVIAEQDVVITTAAVPGRKAPILVTREMVAGLAPGSVIVDLAAERGGNCELTRAGETVVENGVSVLGPVNVPSSVPNHSSQMYARNLATFVKHLMGKEKKLEIHPGDEITRETLVARGGEVVHARVRDLLEGALAGR
ncbi:MAG: Re/Si-specific NAD(P)(+) transhydrogenase subunit alpha [Bryobacteraceae bacterium]|nr:Re/Si-specific NAD(P)(+) transhydrogenase subunit alpha [Bryobacteraceae bacterium]